MSVLTSTKIGASAYAPSYDSGFNLSEEDVRGLMADASIAPLVAVTKKIADAYGQQTLQSPDTKAAEQIFRLLVRQTEIQVRQTLAEHIKSSATLPRDIVMTLAKDIAEVSLPILQYSQALSDDDLLDLIRNTENAKRYLAISKRSQVSEIVSESLLDKNNGEVTLSLLANAGASIDEGKLINIAVGNPDNDLLIQAIRHRPNLPITVAEKLIHAVSTSMGESLKQKRQVPGQDIEAEVEKTRESETLKLIRVSSSQEDIERLVGQLIAFNRLSPSLILSSLCQGSFGFFETSLARLSNIPLSNARTLIKDRGDLGFRAIYNKSDLPDSLFPAVRLLLKVIHQLDEEGAKPNSSDYANRVVDDILKQSSATPVDNLSYIIALVRRAVQ